MTRAHSVFISYSWDSTSHKKWVERLALRLLNDGIHVVFDQWSIRPGESLTEFMERGIKAAGHVIVVCTPQYAKRSNQRKGGVGYEQQMISARIAAGIPRRKFIPIVRAGGFQAGKGCAIPTHFAGILALDMRTRYKSQKSISLLTTTILGNKKQKGNLLLAKPPVHNGKYRVNRLPDTELDGWQLSSGVAIHEVSPKTFFIPSEAARRNVKKDEYVKLVFSIRVEDDPTFMGERMWVKVLGQDGPYYFGTLANHPVSFSSEDQKKLKFGSAITFLPEHIIEIDRALGKQ